MKPWEKLARRAFKLLDGVGPDVPWTMGGGTVLMLRHNHRLSRDVDIFFPDPQPLGHVNPRLGGLAEAMTSKFEEDPGHIKLFFPEGEIDFVASPLLTSPGFSEGRVLGKTVRLETDAEIVAKKMWHRGHEAKARDLFDLSLVIERSPGELSRAAEFLLRHRDSFLKDLEARRDILEAQFGSIATLDYAPAFDECAERVGSFLGSLRQSKPR